MASQFLEIYTVRFIEEILDQLSSVVELELEDAKSDTTKTVLELGYKRCLRDFYNKLSNDITTFVDRDNIHSTEGMVPYESDVLTNLTVHPDNNYSEPLTFASELPDEIFVKEIAYIKK